MAIRVRFCELSGPRDTMEGCLAASDLAGVHEPGQFILGYPGSFSQCLMKLSRTCAKIQNGEGARMRALIRVLAAAVALAMSTGTAFAVMGKTNTDVALRRAPNPQAELILSFRRHAGECRPLPARLVWCNLGQIWRLCAGERTPIPESPGSWSTCNSSLSPLSL